MLRLARALRQSDWDTEDESAQEFAEYPYVIDALIAAGAGCSECRKFCDNSCT